MLNYYNYRNHGLYLAVMFGLILTLVLLLRSIFSTPQSDEIIFSDSQSVIEHDNTASQVPALSTPFLSEPAPIAEVVEVTTPTEIKPSETTESIINRIYEISNITIDKDPLSGLPVLRMISGSDPQSFYKLGFEDDDLLSEVNGTPIQTDSNELIKLLNNLNLEETIDLTIIRGGYGIKISLSYARFMNE